ncbi:MarR family winged helix-turn-helix transcriptional regulator [Schlesneria paludicola]|uniref:MarR family winged helix-turn-helix transcriptional regulator n=1 Tax=Schlesneria paludicola TaxID=360056 RepID=UPI00029B45DC|nr:MarR family winged helix-turn-helix transcriptional regulator [Schlesneria paludicola]
MVTPQELAPLMAEFGKAFTRKIFSEMGRAGTTPARAKLLMTLQCHGGCKMTDISSHLEVTPRSVTKLVDGLENEGLVIREPHPHDRRATIIRLTPEGVLVSKESMLANNATVTELFEQLPPVDRQHMARILRKLIEKLAGPAQDADSETCRK